MRFLYRFLKPQVYGLLSGFPTFSFTVYCRKKRKRLSEFEEKLKRLRVFEEIEPQGKAVEDTVNSKEENSSDFCLDFLQEIVLCPIMAVISCLRF